MNFTESRTRIGQFRVAAGDAMSYMGTYIYALIPIERPGIGTMAVDKYGRLYHDPAYTNTVSLETGMWTVLHESLHLVFDHAGMAERIIGKAPTNVQANAWNFACDMVVNEILRQYLSHAPEGIVTAGRFGLPPKRTAIEYYHMLMDINDNQRKEQNDDTQDQQEDEQGEQQDDEQGDGDEGSEGEEPGTDQTGDDDGDDGGDPDADGPSDSVGGEPELTDHEGKGGSCSDGQPRDYELPADDSWEDRSFSMTADLEAKCEETGWGSVPGELRVALDAKVRPQPDPFDVLRAACCRAVASPVGSPDFTYRRMSRRQVEDAPRLKGVVKTTPSAIVVLDTSGSMTNRETQDKALTVVASALRRLRSVKVICGDTHIASNKTVTNLKQVDWAGGGGTSMRRVLEEADRIEKPDAIVLITDGYTDWPERLRARLVVALTEDRPTPSWAKSVLVKKKEVTQ
jgi:predicted metal-dependent peptidase